MIVWRRSGRDFESDEKEIAVTFRTSVMKVLKLISLWLCSTTIAVAQLAVTVSAVQVVGQKAIVPLAFKNGLAQNVESARAVVFVLDEQGKVVSQATRWVIGGSQSKGGLTPGATNAFHFVIASQKPFATTNLTVKVSFSRVVLAGGKLADVNKDVTIENARK